MNTYITSDTHFGHKNLIKGESSWDNKDGCRPFDTVKEHDETILDRINSVVKEDDVLYHLGDFSLGNKDKKVAYIQYRQQIRCKNIVYILGNHSLSYHYSQDIFSEVHTYLERKINGRYCIMFHYPIASWNHKNKGSYMCSGHCHMTLKIALGKQMDFAVDGHNWGPWLFEEAIAHMDSLPRVEIDHHH